MPKGTRREREAREIYERAGYWVYSPQNPKYGDNDLWNLFDLAAFRVTDGQLRFVQVKSNGARGITKWCNKARHFQTAGVEADFVVPYDRQGWRLIQPTADGYHTTLYDERNKGGNMGEGLEEYLRP